MTRDRKAGSFCPVANSFCNLPVQSAGVSEWVTGTVNVTIGTMRDMGNRGKCGAVMTVELREHVDGIWTAPGARIIDRTGRRRLPIGDDGFTSAAAASVLVDKTALIADVLDSGYKATLFCRPRRFGKTLNMTMMKAFFEAPPAGAADPSLFEGTEVWELGDGSYREHFAAYPVIYLSMRTAKGDAWGQTYGALKDMLTAEFARHSYLLDSNNIGSHEKDAARDILSGSALESDYAGSVLFLARLLRAYHHRPVVLLIDEYDAPVMAGYSAPDGGYYREVVTFLKRLLTGPLKDGGEVLAFACLTGVQRVTKESIFSDLNNLVVSTALSTDSDERFGFTPDEVASLIAYMGYPDEGYASEARRWYDGYRFGNAEVYNPWSLLNYINYGCSADVYWGNTSGNAVVGDLMRGADESTTEEIYKLLEPGGVVWAPLDLGIVFPEMGLKGDALWSMLYLSGYLTTDQTALPNDTLSLRPLRIPNLEVARLYRAEIVERFLGVAGGRARLMLLHGALMEGNAPVVGDELARIAENAASAFDLTSENSWHMLLLGLLFNMRGYADPISNREYGLGRPDIRVEPVESPFAQGKRPLITVELKYGRDADSGALERLSAEALQQIGDRRYDEGPLPDQASSRVRWGIACSGKCVKALSARA